jgi:hypothetical protein
MKEKHYKQKREDLKKEKRIGLKNTFESNKQRNKFVQDIKRCFRS